MYNAAVGGNIGYPTLHPQVGSWNSLKPLGFYPLP